MTVELENTAPEAEQPSTVLTPEVNTPKPSGMKLDEPEKPAKPMSVDEAVRKAAEEANAPKESVKEPKPKAEVDKPEQPRENGKFKAKEPAPEAESQEIKEPSDEQSKEDDGAERDGDGKRPSEGRDDKPPAQFLPRAKEKWTTVDPDIRSEVKRMETEFQKGKEAFEEDRTFRKELRQFEDMAKEAGLPLSQAVKNYVEIDNLVTTNPVAGVERILASQGIKLVDFAQHVLGQAQAEQANPALAQNRQMEQRMQQLEQELHAANQRAQEAQQQSAFNQIQQTIIAPFMAEHPRYEELQEDIYKFLNSGMISSTYSAQERLAKAYVMAERQNPVDQPFERLKPAPDDRPLNPAGKKSIRGAPSAGTSFKPNSAIVSIEDAVKAAMAER